MRQPLVAGNWKMNGSSQTIQALLERMVPQLATQAEILICPPAVYLQQVREQLLNTPIKWGLQTIADKLKGAYTGEISPLMAKDLGCDYVIIGHSERRARQSETDQCVAAKFYALIEQGITPILCVGETLAAREAGNTMAVVTSQIEAVLALTNRPEALGRFVIAYEPVWAIGTGLTATPEQAQAVHGAVRALLARKASRLAETTRILYGGSMTAANAADLMARQDVDGGLVGGASLVADEFSAICNAVRS